MEARLTDEDKQLLKSIYAPQVVGLQPEDSRCGICVMPDGELRHYGVDPVVGPDGVRVWKRCYLSSVDCGLSWKFHYVASESCMGSVVKMPWSDRYITLISDSCGCTALLSDIGPDDPAPRRVKISDKKHSDFFQPKFMKSRRNSCHSGPLSIRDGKTTEASRSLRSCRTDGF